MTALAPVRQRRWKPFHRRTLDEHCKVCGRLPGQWCLDQRKKDEDVPTVRLHRYRPFKK